MSFVDLFIAMEKAHASEEVRYQGTCEVLISITLVRSCSWEDFIDTGRERRIQLIPEFIDSIGLDLSQ